jgi:hypothetical protein
MNVQMTRERYAVLVMVSELASIWGLPLQMPLLGIDVMKTIREAPEEKILSSVSAGRKALAII